MHPNPAFRKPETARNIAFARARGFGTLALSGPEGPLLSHIPFLLDPTGQMAELHLVRSNPIARMDGPQMAVIAVQGPDGYVSPDWYGVPDQVPTWNYVAVHLRGTLTPLPSTEMAGMLDRQSAAYEERLAPKRPWTTDKMTPGVMEKMMRQILPFRFEVEDIQGTWKLNQNKPDDVRLRAAEAIATDGIGSELDALAALMRDP